MPLLYSQYPSNGRGAETQHTPVGNAGLGKGILRIMHPAHDGKEQDKIQRHNGRRNKTARRNQTETPRTNRKNRKHGKQRRNTSSNKHALRMKTIVEAHIVGQVDGYTVYRLVFSDGSIEKNAI